MDTQSSFESQAWRKVGILTVALLGLWSVELFLMANAWDMSILLSVLAGTSGILLAMSFSLSSFGYYFNFLDSKLVYRKYFGLVGYFLALIYALLTAFLYPAIYAYSLPGSLLTIEVGFAVAAMGILTVMALVSNKKAITILGGRLWKNILGLGYIAYALLIIRGIFLDSALWADVLNGEIHFTVRMFLTALGFAVLLFRVSVPFHKKYAILH